MPPFPTQMLVWSVRGSPRRPPPLRGPVVVGRVDDAAVPHVDARVVREMIVQAPVPAEVACCDHRRQTRVEPSEGWVARTRKREAPHGPPASLRFGRMVLP